MPIREYQENDLAALRAIHAAQGFAYPLPNLNNPLFLTKLVLTRGDGTSPEFDAVVAPGFSRASACEHDAKKDAGPFLRQGELKAGATTTAPVAAEQGSGEIIGAALLRLTAEAYLLLDPRVGTPRERWQWLLALHAATERDAWQRGLEDVHAWLPPPIAQKFGKHLTRLGWLRDDAWTPYCKKIQGCK